MMIAKKVLFSLSLGAVLIACRKEEATPVNDSTPFEGRWHLQDVMLNGEEDGVEEYDKILEFTDVKVGNGFRILVVEQEDEKRDCYYRLIQNQRIIISETPETNAFDCGPEQNGRSYSFADRNTLTLGSQYGELSSFAKL